jgi:hypothetical protein
VKVTCFTGDVEHITGFGTEAEAEEWIETKPPNSCVINLVKEAQTAWNYSTA